MTQPKTTTRRILACALALGLMLTAAAAVEARNGPAMNEDQEDITVPLGGSSAEGAGVAQFSGCPQTNPDLITLSGSGSGTSWSFQYTTENQNQSGTCDGWTNSATASGMWDPAVGGCLTFSFFYQLCLTNPQGVPGVAATYSYSNSFDANSGTVALVFS